MLYCSWDMVRDRCNYFSFWTIFCPFTHPTPHASPPPNSLKNQKSKKMKKGLEISSFYTCVPKMMIRWCMVPEYGMQQTEGWTDGQKKWHIEVGAPPKKNQYFKQSATLFVMNKKKDNCKQNSFIQTLV